MLQNCRGIQHQFNKKISEVYTEYIDKVWICKTEYLKTSSISYCIFRMLKLNHGYINLSYNEFHSKKYMILLHLTVYIITSSTILIYSEIVLTKIVNVDRLFCFIINQQKPRLCSSNSWNIPSDNCLIFFIKRNYAFKNKSKITI